MADLTHCARSLTVMVLCQKLSYLSITDADRNLSAQSECRYESAHTSAYLGLNEVRKVLFFVIFWSVISLIIYHHQASLWF